jgi:hypothetical protein
LQTPAISNVSYTFQSIWEVKFIYKLKGFVNDLVRLLASYNLHINQIAAVSRSLWNERSRQQAQGASDPRLTSIKLNPKPFNSLCFKASSFILDIYIVTSAQSHLALLH